VAWYRRWLAQPWLLARRPLLRRRLRRQDVERVEGIDLLIYPGVHHPVVFRSGAWFARILANLTPEVLSLRDGPVAHALDLGTGTGLQALVLARRGFQVIATDINPVAVRCAHHNVRNHRLEHRIHCVQADLFAPFPPARFDLVVSNPPFFSGLPTSAADAAWRSPDLPDRIARGLDAILAPEGAALFVLSTDGAPDRFLDALEANAWAVRAVARRDFGNEIMTVYRAQRR